MSTGFGWRGEEPDAAPWQDPVGDVPSGRDAPTQDPRPRAQPEPHPPAPSPALGRVLVVDDEPFFAEALADMLVDEGFDVVAIAPDGEQAIARVRELEPQVVLMDLRMPGIDGIHAARVITKEFPAIQVLMLSAYEETSLRQEASWTGVFCYLVKGCPPELVIEQVRKALDRHDLQSRRAIAEAQRRAESA